MIGLMIKIAKKNKAQTKIIFKRLLIFFFASNIF